MPRSLPHYFGGSMPVVDRADGLARGMCHCHVYGPAGPNVVELGSAGGCATAQTNAVAPGASVLGMGHVTTSSVDGQIVGPSTSPWPSADPDYSMRWTFIPSDTSNYSGLHRANGGSTGVYIKNGALIVYVDGAGEFTIFSPISVGQAYDVILTHVGGSGLFNFYVNGQYTQFSSTKYTPQLDRVQAFWGDSYTQYTQWMKGLRLHFAAWTRALSATEAAAMVGVRLPYITRAPRKGRRSMVVAAQRRVVRPFLTVAA